MTTQRRMQCLGLGSLLAGAQVIVPGCATEYARPGIVVTDASGKAHAECPVCKCNGDMACVDVIVGSDTPTAAYGDGTYYFCSDECRGTFCAQPRRYTGQGEGP